MVTVLSFVIINVIHFFCYLISRVQERGKSSHNSQLKKYFFFLNYFIALYLKIKPVWQGRNYILSAGQSTVV